MEIQQEGYVICDLKPSKLMFFKSSFRWKLIDLESIIRTETRLSPNFESTEYTAPEIRCAKEKSVGIANNAMDMYSFGRLVLDVLTESEISPVWFFLTFS